jgi:glyoxylase-like metal-dependent hydrolase (beta-lactamase superfamily II)
MPDEAAKFVWKLARRHSWGSPIPDNQLIRMVAGTGDHDELRRVLNDEVLELGFIVRSPDGVYIPNGHDTHIEAANWLREHTGLDDFTIKATLSRLPDDWPNED